VTPIEADGTEDAPQYFKTTDSDPTDPTRPINGDPVTVVGTSTIAGKSIVRIENEEEPFESEQTLGMPPPGYPIVTGYAKAVCWDSNSRGAVFAFRNEDGSHAVGVLTPEGLEYGYTLWNFEIDMSTGIWSFQTRRNGVNFLFEYNPFDRSCLIDIGGHSFTGTGVVTPD
jgi:hypothetical protein